jgi:ribonuclease HI
VASPSNSWLKLNFDDSAMLGRTSVGGILYNSMGNKVVAYMGNCRGGSNNGVEAMSLLCGLRIVRAQDVNKLAIEGDLVLIIKATKGEGRRN